MLVPNMEGFRVLGRGAQVAAKKTVKWGKNTLKSIHDTTPVLANKILKGVMPKQKPIQDSTIAERKVTKTPDYKFEFPVNTNLKECRRLTAQDAERNTVGIFNGVRYEGNVENLEKSLTDALRK